MWNLRTEYWARQYLGEQFYLRVYTNSVSIRDEFPIPKNAAVMHRETEQVCSSSAMIEHSPQDVLEVTPAAEIAQEQVLTEIPIAQITPPPLTDDPTEKKGHVTYEPLKKFGKKCLQRPCMNQAYQQCKKQKPSQQKMKQQGQQLHNNHPQLHQKKQMNIPTRRPSMTRIT